MRWCSVPGSAAARIKVGGCEAKSLCPNAQTKTHVSTSLQSDHSRILQPVANTPCAPSCRASAAKRTRSHDPSCTPCTPHSGSTSRLQSHMRQWHRWHARTRYIHRRRARMGCGPGTCLRMQVCNARRRMPGEGSRREEPLIRQRQLHGSGACIVHSDGQRPAHRQTNACTSAANRHGCGGRACP